LVVWRSMCGNAANGSYPSLIPSRAIPALLYTQ
jgi:hypothetical protein